MTPEGTNSYSDKWDGPGGGATAAQGLRDDFLMKSYTTVREIAGNSRGLAMASKRGLLIAPRIYTSGAVLSHTSGHGEWGAGNDTYVSDYGAMIQHSMIVDSADDVIKAFRRNYRNGAHFTKIMAGGGVDLLSRHGTQFSVLLKSALNLSHRVVHFERQGISRVWPVECDETDTVKHLK